MKRNYNISHHKAQTVSHALHIESLNQVSPHGQKVHMLQDIGLQCMRCNHSLTTEIRQMSKPCSVLLSYHRCEANGKILVGLWHLISVNQHVLNRRTMEERSAQFDFAVLCDWIWQNDHMLYGNHSTLPAL